jgi:t-SNARE complex subunit (syntaxin)
MITTDNEESTKLAALQGLRTRMAAEYKETVARRYYTVTGEKAEDSTVEALISSGQSETFLHKAIQEQGRGQVLDTISEIQERHDAVKEMERSLLDLHQVFLDMAALVEAQGHQLNDIESHVMHASSFVRRGAVELEAEQPQVGMHRHRRGRRAAHPRQPPPLGHQIDDNRARASIDLSYSSSCGCSH